MEAQPADAPTPAPDGDTTGSGIVSSPSVPPIPSDTPSTAVEPVADVPPAVPAKDFVHDDHNGVNPLDFHGSVDSNDEPPSAATLRKIEDYVVLDREGKPHPFKSLYSGKDAASRVLIIFVRHFFCGVSLPPPLFPRLPILSLSPFSPGIQNASPG